MQALVGRPLLTAPRQKTLLYLSVSRFSTSQWLRETLVTPKINYEEKYAEKLQKRAAQ